MTQPDPDLQLRAEVAREIFARTNVDICGDIVWAEDEILPPWECDRTAAQEVVERIEAMGLRVPFVGQIIANLPDFDRKTRTSELCWIFLKAKPRELIVAALTIIREQRKEGA